MAAGFDMLFLTNMYTTYHPELRRMFQSIKESAGGITVKELSNDVHYSERQLNRIFNQHVGASVKAFSRLIRINHTFRLLKNPNVSLTLISDLAGFHDLSHFYHDFNLVCGVTPQEYRKNMSGFYNNPIKF